MACSQAYSPQQRFITCYCLFNGEHWTKTLNNDSHQKCQEKSLLNGCSSNHHWLYIAQMNQNLNTFSVLLSFTRKNDNRSFSRFRNARQRCNMFYKRLSNVTTSKRALKKDISINCSPEIYKSIQKFLKLNFMAQV